MNSESDDSRTRNHAKRSPTVHPQASAEFAVIENRIDSRELFVEHARNHDRARRRLYRLRLTAQNKLILTK